ncbi:putative carbohydrate-binding -like protein [Rosellinia necatrix]|uniref:Putative carbohydrate-binding-like protein n=1 Tax=Rosellinia necatrix TaxID=77044 RepID=A0A1W2TF37_ROSNE|nr:putative carbohydrate-binding -like protein [Rosellinia necatrix]
MRSGALIISTLVSSVAGQLLDFDLLDAAPQPSIHSMSIEEKPHTVHYDMPAATQAAIADPLPVEVVAKRDLETRTDACSPLDKGAGPIPVPDTAEAFLAYDGFKTAANSAPVPNGYFQTFGNLKASNSAYGYSGFSTLDSYDTGECARRCNNVDSCSGFNIYFERDPAIVPAPACRDPGSTTVIKCVYWGGYISADNADNFGQWREQFHVVIAGSNGYMKNKVYPLPGFNGESLGNASINAPLNCLGRDTYMGAKIFTTSYFDVGLCAAACISQNAYNTAHPPDTGLPKICQFFVTYMSHKNGAPEGQYCAMYTQYWDSSYATNDGQWRGDEHYTNDYVFSYTSSTYVDDTVCPGSNSTWIKPRLRKH